MRTVDTQSMHVMHVAATANGAAWMHQMLVELRNRGHRATAVIGGGDGTLAGRLSRDRIPFDVLDVDVLSCRSVLAAVQKFWSLVALLRRERPDVVHFHLFPSIIVGRLAAWVADVPARFSMIPGTYYLEAPVLGDLDARTARFDSKVIASCEHTRTLYAQRGVSRDLVELVYYGQDASLFDPAAADGLRVRRELGIAADRPVVGDVAYFYPPGADGPFTPPHLVNRGIKGHEVLLRAFQRVHDLVPDALLVLVGEGWGPQGAAYMADLRQLARDLGLADHVIFAGARGDIPDTLRAFDVSVQCSLNENLGGSIESLLMACPLVASDVGGLPDAVKHEETGLLVPPGDADALAAAITRLLRDRPLARRVAEQGRRFALERLTLSRTVTDLEALYRQELHGITHRDGRRPRRYRRGRCLVRSMYMAPWAVRELVWPVKRSLWAYSATLARQRSEPLPEAAPGPPAVATPVPARRISTRRVIQMAGATENSEWLVQICRGLQARGHDISAVIGWPERTLAQQLRLNGIPYGATVLSLAQDKGRLRLLIYAVRLPRIILRLAWQFRKARAKVVHTHIFNSIIIGRLAAWLARVPCRVSMVPGPLHLEAPFTRAVDRMTCWMDHRVVAGCEATYHRYRAMGLSEPRLQCIPYGVDPARFDPDAADGRRVRAELQIAGTAPVIGLVAYFYPPRTDWQTPPHMRGRGVKGHEDLLAAASIVRRRHPDARFLLVGSGWGPAGERYRRQLIELAQADGLGDSVVFTGHRDDVPDVLAAMDVAVQCSLSENYGGTIEALLMCRPTVATRVGGMPETVRHGETGLVVPPRDPAALAAAICQLLESPGEAREYGRAGRQLMLERHTIAHTVNAIDRLYHEVLDGASAPIESEAVAAQEVS
jgi:glycosyltransferase involved in cell wall biosynthesis